MPTTSPVSDRERAHSGLRSRSDTADRALADALPHVIWACDAAGRLEWVNAHWLNLTGMSEEETLNNKGALAAVHPDDLAELDERWQRAFETMGPTEVEYRIRNRAGDYRWHLARIAPVVDVDGNAVRWVAAAFDVHDHRITEEALRASERRFETIFHLSPAPSVIARVSDGTFLDANNAFVEAAGFRRDEVVGHTALSLGLWTAEEREAFGASLAEGSERRAEAVFRTKEGRQLRVLLAIARAELGGEPCFVCVGTDVTERQAMEDALRRNESEARARADELAALMDAVPAAVWIAHDPDCREIQGNRAGHEVLRIPMGRNLSKTAADPELTRHFSVFADGRMVSPNDLPLQRAARGEESRNHEEELRFDDGMVTHLFGNAVPLRDRDGTPRGAIGAFLDVTRLKEVEAALRRSDRRKDEFLALLSHELRNPLTPILMAAHLLELRGDPESRHDIEVIVRQVTHLVRLVDDLLDVSRVARGRVQLAKRRMELACVVERALEATMPLFQAQSQFVEVDVPGEGLAIEGDEVRLTQVLDNLLSNASRYTPSGGTVRVTGARDNDWIVLRVRDTGVGLDSNLLPELFEMFVQGPAGPDRPPGGLGIGLALVRSLTELHGGTVTAQSDGPGHGSEFTVRLPAAAAVPDRPPQPDARVTMTTPAPNKTRVLIVDDHRDVANGLARMLRIAGFEVRTALGPKEALALADDFRPRVAILDIGLPEMDGYTLARELRARLGESPPILIALSGYSQAEDKRRSEASGFALHLVKPMDVDVLVGALTELVAKA